MERHLDQAMERVIATAADPMRRAFLARGLIGLARIAAELDKRTLSSATGAPSDYAVLVDALQAPAAVAILTEDDPLAGARLRGLEMRERLVRAEGGVLGAEQVARHLGISRQAADKRRRAGRLLALSMGRRGYAYPVWQFAQEGVLPGFEQVLAELGAQDPWMQAAFFLSGDARLDGMTPLAALREGRSESVCRAARGYGEHSAA
jgi:hypothetical protein